MAIGRPGINSSAWPVTAASLENFSAVNDIVSFRMLVREEDEHACYRILGRVNKYFSRNLGPGPLR